MFNSNAIKNITLVKTEKFKNNNFLNIIEKEKIDEKLKKNDLDFSNCIIINYDFSNHYNLKKAIFNNSHIVNCNFRSCDLKMLNDSCFDKCIFDKVGLEDGNLKNSFFKNCYFFGTYFTRAECKNVTFLNCGITKKLLEESRIKDIFFLNIINL